MVCIASGAKVENAYAMRFGSYAKQDCTSEDAMLERLITLMFDSFL